MNQRVEEVSRAMRNDRIQKKKYIAFDERRKKRQKFLGGAVEWNKSKLNERTKFEDQIVMNEKKQKRRWKRSPEIYEQTSKRG